MCNLNVRTCGCRPVENTSLFFKMLTNNSPFSYFYVVTCVYQFASM
jgi:hypothetical protein